MEASGLNGSKSVSCGSPVQLLHQSWPVTQKRSPDQPTQKPRARRGHQSTAGVGATQPRSLTWLWSCRLTRVVPHLATVYIQRRHLLLGQHLRLGTCPRPTNTRTPMLQRYTAACICALELHLAFYSARHTHSHAQTRAQMRAQGVYTVCFPSTSPRSSGSSRPSTAPAPAPSRTPSSAQLRLLASKHLRTSCVSPCTHPNDTSSVTGSNSFLRGIPAVTSHWGDEGDVHRCKHTMHR